MKYLAKIKLAKLEFFGIRDEKWIEMKTEWNGMKGSLLNWIK